MKDLQINLPDEIQKTNFRALDGLRAISIIIVIITHVLSAFPIDNTHFGAIGVYTFFVISGFLITTLLLKERLKYNKISLKGFYIRRVLRIIPVAYLYLIVVICLNVIYKLKIPGDSFLRCFLFIKNVPVDPHYWQTGHFWSLATEEQFYLLFPLLIVWLSLRNYKRLIQLLIITIPLLSYVYMRRIDTEFIHVPTPIHLMLSMIHKLFGKGTVLILIGSLFSILYVTQNRLIKRVYENAPDLSSLCLFLIALFLLIPAFPWYVPFLSEPIFGIIIAFVIILNLQERSVFSRFLELKPIKKVGVLSYSIYIWQQLFTYKQPWYNAGTNIFLIILNLIALGVVAWLSYVLYERKFLIFKNHYKRV